MKDSKELIAMILAADEHPHLNEEPEFQEARNQVDSDPDLQSQLEDARKFFKKHPVLVGVNQLPNDSRKRIERAIEKNSSLLSQKINIELSPWTIRTQFAWAALLVLLLAGMAVLSSNIANVSKHQEEHLAYQTQPPADAFRSYAGHLVSRRLPLQQRDADTAVLVNWLEQHSRASLSIPEQVVADREGIGCATLDGPNGEVSLLCFEVDGQIIHLFITDAGSLNLNTPSQPKKLVINGRKALQWNDSENAYLLLSHKPEEELPEMFL